MVDSFEKKRSAMEVKAAKLLERCESLPLASIDEEGYPRICEMEKVKANGFSEIYFTTLKKSEKTKHFLADNKASVSYYVDNDSVSLIGHIEVIEDIETKKQIWQGDHTKRFIEDNDGPTFCILRFRATKARFFIDGEKITCKVCL